MDSGHRLDIGIDLDGVVYDFVEALRDWIATTTGRPRASMPDALIMDFWKQWDLTTPEFLDFYKEGVHAQSILRVGTPIPGSAETMRALHDAGHRLHIITARNLPGFQDEALSSTYAWLHEHDIPYDELTLSDVKHIAQTDLFLEDAPANYDALEAAGRHPWLLSAPYNAHHTGRRINSWWELPEVVDGLAVVLSRAA